MRLRHLEAAAALGAADWDRCFPPDYPFTRHAFLSALEACGCVTPETGWTPCHAVLEDAHGKVRAIAPLYLKAHSYGEFVFDFSWAQASQELGRPYYPRLVNAVPFTPVTGPRLGAIDEAARAALAAALPQAAEANRLSSFHALFPEDADLEAFAAAGCLERHDVQFHWRNQGYADFPAFLACLSSDKRKKLLRERRRVAEAGLRFERRRGEDLGEAAWAQVYALYANTYEERGQAPYLNLDFLLSYGQAAGSPVRLVLAYDGTRMVAVAITLLGGDTLYGRHWGAQERYHSLHFETCYYQGIEWCIQEGWRKFDAGTQGEHKLARGFEPVRTRSAHWLADARLRRAVERALQRERALVGMRGEALAGHSPFRSDLAQDQGSDPAAAATEPADG